MRLNSVLLGWESICESIIRYYQNIGKFNKFKRIYYKLLLLF